MLHLCEIINSDTLVIFDIDNLNFFKVNKALTCLNDDSELQRECIIMVQ